MKFVCISQTSKYGAGEISSGNVFFLFAYVEFCNLTRFDKIHIETIIENKNKNKNYKEEKTSEIF